MEIVKPQKGEEKDAYSFSAWNAVGAFTMKELSRLFETPYEPVESDFSEKMGEWGIKIALSNRWQ